MFDNRLNVFSNINGRKEESLYKYLLPIHMSYHY